MEEDSSSGSNSGGKPPKDGSSGSGKGGRKWWQVGSLSKSKSAAKGSNGNSGSSKSAARAAADEAAQAQQRQRQERVHQLVTSALDVLLRLTPLPAGQDSTFKSVSRPDVSPVRSLALPLMAHCDTAKALSGCIWSSWPDVQTKAVSGVVRGCVGAVFGAVQGIGAKLTPAKHPRCLPCCCAIMHCGCCFVQIPLTPTTSCLGVTRTQPPQHIPLLCRSPSADLLHILHNTCHCFSAPSPSR